jgi:hypothetical protein
LKSLHSAKLLNSHTKTQRRKEKLSELRVRAKTNSQILSVEAPAGQGAKVQEYQAYSELSQHRQAGCVGA